jgi:FkbM family methyltransferase
MRAQLDRFVNRNSRSSFIRRIARNCDRFLKHFWNESNWDFDRNGEERVLRILSREWSGRRVRVFDVGANRGEWSELVLSLFPGVELHSFEIVPETFQLLSRKLGSLPRPDQTLVLNPVGLSDRTGEVEVSYFPDVDNGSSIAPLPHGIKTVKRTSRITTGDLYASGQGIHDIDLLKVDTEGHDWLVLKGLSGLLDSGAIPCIQFEYGAVCIPARVFLGDFYELLGSRGYRIGRLFPDGVDFKEYSVFHDEHFRAGNYIAVHGRHDSLIRNLMRSGRKV